MRSARRVNVGAELRAELPARLDMLGFRPEDAADVLAAVAAATDADLELVERFANRLVARIGTLPPGDGETVWVGLDRPANGIVPLLALVATAGAVSDFHAAHGVDRATSWAGLADLGQQVAVHRVVHGRFGLETYGWLAGHVWTGSMFWLGRLQFGLERAAQVDGAGQDWVIGTHIPRTGRLDSDEVDASFAAAHLFFAEHFPDVPARDVHCRSWMLDARLPELLPGSNLAAFQQRWLTYGEPGNGDADVTYFAFATRGPVDPATVATTSLQRVVLSLWESGAHWHVVDGRLAA